MVNARAEMLVGHHREEMLESLAANGQRKRN
jgi:hypothetical protein